jgi:hypothetical protein
LVLYNTIHTIFNWCAAAGQASPDVSKLMLMMREIERQ